MTNKFDDIRYIYSNIPGVTDNEDDWAYGGQPNNDEWRFARAIVDLIDRKVKEQDND